MSQVDDTCRPLAFVAIPVPFGCLYLDSRPLPGSHVLRRRESPSGAHVRKPAKTQHANQAARRQPDTPSERTNSRFLSLALPHSLETQPQENDLLAGSTSENTFTPALSPSSLLPGHRQTIGPHPDHRRRPRDASSLASGSRFALCRPRAR